MSDSAPAAAGAAVDLGEIEARVNAASEGPWRSTGHQLHTDRDHSPTNVFADDKPIAGTDWAADADFIAHAREDVPCLLALARQGVALREALVRVLNTIHPLTEDWMYQEESAIEIIEAALAPKAGAP